MTKRIRRPESVPHTKVTCNGLDVTCDDCAYLQKAPFRDGPRQTACVARLCRELNILVTYGFGCKFFRFKPQTARVEPISTEAATDRTAAQASASPE
jgi:hypothetical protein